MTINERERNSTTIGKEVQKGSVLPLADVPGIRTSVAKIVDPDTVVVEYHRWGYAGIQARGRGRVTRTLFKDQINKRPVLWLKNPEGSTEPPRIRLIWTPTQNR